MGVMVGRVLYVIRRPAILLLSLVAVTATVIPGAASPPPEVVSEVAATPEAPEPPVADPTAEPAAVPHFVPTQITLPSLGVTAPIVPVGLESDGAMGTPNNARDVAWWDGVQVGEGNALLAGHKDWNKAQGSFFRLGDLQRGDEIVVTGPEGQELVFVVAWVEQMHKDTDAAGLLGPQGEPTLTLITCGGVFDRSVRGYEDRIVARGVLRT